jgi:hypothetical protein
MIKNILTGYNKSKLILLRKITIGRNDIDIILFFI